MSVRKFVIISSLILASVGANAQEFLFGVKTGVQGYGMAFGDKDLKKQFKSAFKGGYSAGVFINFPLPLNFALNAELNHSVKGRKIKFNNDQWTNNSTYTFIEVPVLLRKFWNIEGLDYAAKWYVNAGPHISYWRKGKGSLETNGPGLDYSIQFADSAAYDITTMYLVDANRFMFGLDFGVGFMAHVLKNQRFFAEARFTYGHTYLGNSDSANLYILGFEDDMRTSYRVLNISVGYAIHLDIRDAKKGRTTATKRKQK